MKKQNVARKVATIALISGMTFVLPSCGSNSYDVMPESSNGVISECSYDVMPEYGFPNYNDNGIEPTESPLTHTTSTDAPLSEQPAPSDDDLILMPEYGFPQWEEGDANGAPVYGFPFSE